MVGNIKRRYLRRDIDIGEHDPLVHVECIVKASEDANKVIKAVSNVINGIKGMERVESYADGSAKVVVDTHGLSALETIRMQIHARNVMNTFKRIMLSNKSSDCKSTWLYLNKQAAYAGVVSICEYEDESPLGPIKVTITDHKGILPIIEWLTL